VTASRFDTRLVTWQDAEPHLRAVRGEVFVREQGIPDALEWDMEDDGAIHALVTVPDHQPVATGRLLIQGGHARIGRMAVLPAWRGQGAGTTVLKCLLEEARQRNVHEVVLHAQTTAVTFYEQFGFVCVGDEYLEAGIPHRRMSLVLD